MVECDHAVAIMGNHELNALHYHSRGKNFLETDDGFMRAHDDKNMGQHETFLAEYPVGGDATEEVLNWFLTLPLFLELDGLRLVHACWDSKLIDLVKQRNQDAVLKVEDLQEVALEQTNFALAIVNLLKGPEVKLPPGYAFKDYRGNPRKHIRIKWWAQPGGTWRDAALSVPDPSRLPDSPIGGEINTTFYADDAPPVFFGHYKRPGRLKKPDARNVLCLDYPETPCAYRWHGEQDLIAENVVQIGESDHAAKGEPD